ncbi:glycosyltransferase family 2 protein, partial [Gemmatimonadota bacterium]
MTDDERDIKATREDLLRFAEDFQPGPPEGPWAEDVTVVIKTFERPRCVSQLLRSIRKYFPTIQVLVCDDSRTPLFGDRELPLPGVTWLTLPYELGHVVGAGRNYLADQVTTPFLFLCDDDHVFTEGTRLDLMHRFLTNSGYDLVAGAQGKG